MLTELHAVVAQQLAGAAWPVHRWLPDDVGELPCIAVARPRLTPGDPSVVVAGTVAVLVVGSRLNDSSAQAELDATTDAVVADFGGLAHVVGLEHPLVKHLTLEAVNPVSVFVAGAEYPAYELTVAAVLTSTC